MRQLFDSRVVEIGVTRAKWMLIGAVANNPGATQRELAADLDVTDVTAGRLVDKVCADGLLERRPHPQDRRAYCVYLTEAAQPVLAKLAKAAIAFEAEMFADIVDADVDALNALLDKISTNLVRALRHGDASGRTGTDRAKRSIEAQRSGPMED